MVFLGCQQSSAGMHYPKYSDIHGNRCILAYHGGKCHRPGLIPGYRSIRRWTDDTYVAPKRPHTFQIPLKDTSQMFSFSSRYRIGPRCSLFQRDHIFHPIPSYIGYAERIHCSLSALKQDSVHAAFARRTLLQSTNSAGSRGWPKYAALASSSFPVQVIFIK